MMDRDLIRIAFSGENLIGFLMAAAVIVCLGAIWIGSPA